MKTQEEYNAMSHRELWDAMQTAGSYEMRKIHKALKKYKDGVPFMYRYPDFPIHFSVIALIVAVLVAVLKLLVF